jgi:pimeloyl-ACP methyl ester carboxylesterase
MADHIHLVLVPGLLGTEALFQPQVEGLSDLGTVVVTRAHLRHDTVEEMAQAILTESPPKFAIAGSSMGGYVALLVKKLGGDRVTHLGLLDSTAAVEGEARQARRRAMLDATAAGEFDAVKAQMLKLFLQPDNQGNQRLVKTVNDMADSVGPDRFTRQVSALSAATDLTDFLPKVMCPTLVLCGALDELLPPELSRDMLKLLPKAKLALIAEAAHLITLERPETVNELMRQWLTGALPMDGGTMELD